MADKKELLRFCGSLEQAAGVRRIEYQDGRASGLRCALVQNGPLEFLLMLDKCLDPAWIRYKGLNMSFLSKPGLQGRNPYEGGGTFHYGRSNVYLRPGSCPWVQDG